MTHHDHYAFFLGMMSMFAIMMKNYHSIGRPVGTRLSQKTKDKIGYANRGNNYAGIWWEITSPIGERYVIKGPQKFFISHKLSPSIMSAVAKGRHHTHKGWTCRHLTVEEIAIVETVSF